MLQGLKIFKMGLRWRVGDRAHIKIWHDQLIPRSVNFKPLLYLLNLRVANLILMNHRRWNTSPPHSTLGSIYVHEIKRILLCAIKNNDALIWHYTPLGEFTVFSAYKKRWSKRIKIFYCPPLPRAHLAAHKKCSGHYKLFPKNDLLAMVITLLPTKVALLHKNVI